MIKVALVTVNYNGKKDTLELLQSLSILQSAPYLLQTIVVDNGSDDGLVEELTECHPDVVVLQNGANKGFAGGFNRGIDYGLIWGADYFLLINNDCSIKDANLLDELIKTAKNTPKIGIVSPKIYFAPGFEFHKDRYKKTDLGKVIWYGGGSFDWDNVQGIHRGIDDVDFGQYDEIEKTDFISGACMLIKKEVFEKVGKFNEDYFLYFEDVEFQKRVDDAGYKKFYNGQVAIYHKVSQSTEAGSSLTDYYTTRNRLIFGMQYANFKTRFALLRQSLWQLLLGRSGQKKGIWDFFMADKRGNSLGANVNHLEGGLDSHLRVEYAFKLSICIVSYNTADLTKKLLESIFKKKSGFDRKNMEVIVLDNGSEDRCEEVIKLYLNKISYIQNQENAGFSAGYNKTIRFSRGEYILLLNSDIEVLENSLPEMVKWADHFQGKAVLGGKLVFPDGKNQDSVYNLPTLTGAFNEYFLAKPGSYFMFQPKGDSPVKVEGLVMACFLIPRQVINQVGLLDEGTFIFFEDLEYCRRLKSKGIPLFYLPSAKFIHHHGGSTKRIGREKAYQHLQESAIRYHGKFYYRLLSLVLRIGQKLNRIKTPTSRWSQAK